MAEGRNTKRVTKNKERIVEEKRDKAVGGGAAAIPCCDVVGGSCGAWQAVLRIAPSSLTEVHVGMDFSGPLLSSPPPRHAIHILYPGVDGQQQPSLVAAHEKLKA